MIKLVMCDCDGTLISSDQTISQNNIDSIKKLLRNGVYFAISTGRFRFGCKEIFKQLDIKPEEICASYDNGTYVDIYAKEVLNKSINKTLLKKIIPLSQEYNCSPVIYSDKNWYISKRDKWYDAVDKFYPSIGKIADLNEVVDFLSSVKISVRGERENLYELSKVIELKIPELKTFLSRSTILEVVGKDVDKGEALKYLATYFGISLSQTMAIGDYNNDIDMIKAAGIGVAMENAGDEVKKNATYITSSNDDDGVCKAIEKFVFEC